MHVGPNLVIEKELFNESQLHIIFHPFYTQQNEKKKPNDMHIKIE